MCGNNGLFYNELPSSSSCFDFRKGQDIYFSKASRPSLLVTVSSSVGNEVPFPVLQSDGGVSLITHFYLVPRLRMGEAVRPLPPLPRMNSWLVWGYFLLLFILSSTSSSSSASPSCRVFTLMFVKQTMPLRNTVLQLFYSYYSWCI